MGLEFLVAMQAGSALLGGLSERNAARDQERGAEDQLEFQRRVAEQNIGFHTEVTRQNVAIALQDAAINERRLRRENKRRIALSRAAVGSSGLALTGSPLAALADMTRVAEEDAFLVRRAGRLRAHREEVTGRALVRRELVGIASRTLEFDQLSSALRSEGTASLLTGIGGAAGSIIRIQ